MRRRKGDEHASSVSLLSSPNDSLQTEQVRSSDLVQAARRPRATQLGSSPRRRGSMLFAKEKIDWVPASAGTTNTRYGKGQICFATVSAATRWASVLQSP